MKRSARPPFRLAFVTASFALVTFVASVVPALAAPRLQHVFVIVLENQAEDNTFGVKMPVPYLETVSGQGAFVMNYWGTSHYSLGNYVSLVSGMSVTTANQQDCPAYTQIAPSAVVAYDQVVGSGCVYPTTTLTLADQLTSAGFTYHGYMEGMGDDPAREAATCGQTQPTATSGVYGAGDDTKRAQVGDATHPTDQYAQKHNPFAYFMSVIGSGSCAKNVVPLDDATLTNDLKSVATTPNFSLIVPDLCDDGHDVPCAAPGSAGTTNPDYSNENAFLMKWVPIITRSPAFARDGLLMITFDESSPSKNANVGTDTTFDGSSCCNETAQTDPNTTTPGIPPGASGITDGSGGGKTGTLLLSPFIAPGTVTSTSYNHYAALHSFEDDFGFSYLGYAGFPGTVPFGDDIFGRTPMRHAIAL